jgi:hypothetical protein
MKKLINVIVAFTSLLGVTPMVHAENVLSIVSGDKQTAQRLGDEAGGYANFEALSVVVKDQAGKPVPNVSVKFDGGSGIPSEMAYQFNDRGDHSISLTSDEKGVVVLKKLSGGKSVLAYYATGKLPIAVTAEDCNQVVFDLTVTDPPAIPAIAGATMEITAGDNQKVKRDTGDPATAYFKPLQVTIKDSAGKPLGGVKVLFKSGGSKAAGMAVQLEPGGSSDAIVTTAEDGVATLKRMMGNSVDAYYADGPFTILASYGTAEVKFKLTVGEGASWRVR